MKAWIRQKKEDIENAGPRKAPWIVFWKTPENKPKSRSCGVGAEGKKLAKQLQATIHAQLVTGTYKGDPTLHLWDTFMVEYRRKKLRKMGAIHCEVILVTVAHFERHLQPVSLSQITTEFIDTFITRRSADRGQKRGTTVAAATINKDLRNLKLIVQVAKDWKLLEELPKFHMLREPSRIKRFVTPEHFAAMIDMADQLTTPQLPNVTPCQYWQAFLSFMYVTGWRLNEVLNIRRDDVDFETGQGNDAILQTNRDGFSWELVAN